MKSEIFPNMGPNNLHFVSYFYRFQHLCKFCCCGRSQNDCTDAIISVGINCCLLYQCIVHTFTSFNAIHQNTKKYHHDERYGWTTCFRRQPSSRILWIKCNFADTTIEETIFTVQLKLLLSAAKVTDCSKARLWNWAKMCLMTSTMLPHDPMTNDRYHPNQAFPLCICKGFI